VERRGSGHGNSSYGSSSHFEMPFHYGQDRRTAKATELSHSTSQGVAGFVRGEVGYLGTSGTWGPGTREECLATSLALLV